MEHNFASVEIEPIIDERLGKTIDHEVTLSLRDKTNQVRQQRKLRIKRDITFNKRITHYDTMCIQSHTGAKKIHMAMRLIQSFVEDHNHEFILQFCLLIFTLVLLPLAIVLRIVNIIVRFVIRLTYPKSAAD